jgi:hypothetical protein
VLNPVTRGDLHARLGSGRGIRLQTVYLIACSAFLLLSLPPEIGRLDLRDANLLLAFLVVQAVGVTYLSSAVASSEVAIEGEKGLADLVLSAFSPATVAAGKVASSAWYALYLIAIALPLVVLSASIRGGALGVVAWVGVLTIAMATAAGTWGAWLGGRFTSDFARSLAHWSLLSLVFGATMLLPASWWPASPLRLIDETVRRGASAWLFVAVAAYLALTAAGAWSIARLTAYARSLEGAV